MQSIFYDIFIYPLVQILNLCYVFFFRVFNNHGISIISVSFTVSILTLPLFLEAEKWQQIERNIKNKLSLKISKIKDAFKGDERFMILSAYYKQNNYHPIYSLRSSIGLLLQIPFFIAAYSYLSNLDTLSGTPFLPAFSFGIQNLGTPDNLIKFQTNQNHIFSVNLLPVLMTIINLLASFVYIKGIYPKGSSTYGLFKENVQLIAMALIFLILLYNSPSGLVLYWTFNNIFSLVKNLLLNSKNRKMIIFLTACALAVIFSVYLLFFHHGALYKRIFVSLAALSVFLIPFLKKPAIFIKEKLLVFFNNQNISGAENQTILFSCIILSLLFGIVIPSSLVTSSVSEFSFIENYNTPFPFIIKTLFQSLGFFIFIIPGIYFLLTKNKRYILTFLITGFAFCCILNNFAFPGNYGYITIDLKFSSRDVISHQILFYFLNIFIQLFILTVIFYLLFISKQIIIKSAQIITIICLFSISVINITGISGKYQSVAAQKNLDKSAISSLNNSDYNNLYTPIYEFSANGNNILIIMLDRGISAFIPYIISEKPALNDSFSGFLYYPNTISFSAHTIFSSPSIFGGYDYTPYKINSEKDELLSKKHNEAFKVLPEIFLQNNYNVTLTDLPLHKDSIQSVFASYQNIKALNVEDNYTHDWLSKHPEIQPVSIKNILYNRLIYFSFFKSFPLVFRHYLYDDGSWLAAELGNTPMLTIRSYSMLDVLAEITNISESGNNLNIMVNNLPHEPAFLQAPDYTIPPVSSTNKGNSPFALVNNYHVTMASVLLLGKWFDYLKMNNVYDNTRIIIVSDHGFNEFLPVDNCIKLPTGESILHYAAILLFKDFYSDGNINIDNQFMTNADTAVLALKDIILNPVNPFTGNNIDSDKDNGVIITSSQKKHIDVQAEHYYNIDKKDWLHVHTSIFDSKNWSKLILE